MRHLSSKDVGRRRDLRILLFDIIELKRHRTVLVHWQECSRTRHSKISVSLNGYNLLQRLRLLTQLLSKVCDVCELKRVSEDLTSAILPQALRDHLLALIDQCLLNLGKLLMAQFVLAVRNVFTFLDFLV